ncbi:PD-(D/E)XK nuclease family transposase [Bernardetia sp.]|uniref:PD-(D/E)XK nuclease family transposase n=1 Tax=Bernardetia sp. TaxID=1937974 RepID=UPI0025BEA8CE|nr:PD-(D/E)XK nuclease family transposase [Bernardetia sp.]
MTTDKYINLFTDYGFKKVFGEEPNKDLLIDFLNQLLQDTENVMNLTYLNTEHMGKGERKAVFYKKLTLIFLEIPKFDKALSELTDN